MRPSSRRNGLSVARVAATFAALCALFLSTSAFAQTFTTPIPRLKTPNLWSAPSVTTCPGVFTNRMFTVWTFTAATTGAYTFGLTRPAGTGLAMHLYTGIFSSAAPCANVTTTPVQSTTSFLLLGANLTAGSTYSLVMSSNSTTDPVIVNMAATGPAPLTSVCSDGVLTPDTQTATTGGGAFTTTYTPAPGCNTWSTSGVPTWITLPTSGTTNSISYSVANNTGAARSATFQIGGVPITVSQDPSCVPVLSPNPQMPTAAGGASSIQVQINAGCVWTAAANVTWINSLSPTGGTGNGGVNFNVNPNVAPSRTGNITVLGQSMTVQQESGCTFALPATMASVPPTGGVNQVAVQASDSQCQWSAITATPWITGVTVQGTGNGTVNYTTAANTGPARSGTILIGGRTFTVNQVSGCNYQVSPTTITAPAGLTHPQVTVTAGVGCTWTATNPSNADWIFGLNNGVGNGTVLIEVSDNTSLARSTTLLIAGQSVTVNQADGCRVTGVMPSGTTLFSQGGSGSFTVNTGMSCPWTAMTTDAWITGVTASGVGSNLVNYAVAPNAGLNRTGTIVVGASTYTITQNQGDRPRITTEPADVTVDAGSPFTLRVVAEGLGLTYQWRKHGQNIPGATGDTYTVNAAASADGDTYDVIVSNAIGDEPSLVVTVTVNSATDAGMPDVVRVDAGSDTGANDTGTNDTGTGDVQSADTGPRDTGATADTGGTRDSGTGAEGDEMKTGCACRVPAQPTRAPQGGLALAALSALGLLAARRRNKR